jgi:vacuolar-type H+-ATPase subunit H
MNKNFKILAMVSVFGLAACGSDDNASYETDAEQATETTNKTAGDAVSDAKAKASDLLDKANETVNDIKAKGNDLAVGFAKIDASSLNSFQSSLEDMQKLLPEAQQSKLTNAIASLAKNSVTEGSSSSGGLLDKAKSLADGKSAEELVYEKLGSTMDGMTFDDILKLANQGS